MNTLLHNVKLATMTDNGQAYGLIDGAALRIVADRIGWLGRQEKVEADWFRQDHVVDCEGQLLTPGLIDCHTHLVYAGDRVNEFEQRLSGLSYAQIAAAGGGIQATVDATRRASEEQLLAESLPRVDALLADGVTTLEIKSGYGLSTRDELKMLRVIAQIEIQREVNIIPTFLGAHAIPSEYRGNSEAYIDIICEQMLPAISKARLAKAVDGFCENIAFNCVQMRRVFEKARQLGLSVKLHAEQLSLQGGSRLVAEFDGLSADHLEYLDQSGIEAMASAGTVAVMLPGAFYFLRETRKPPLAGLRAAGIPIAIASDCNPGSSPLFSLPLAMNMACTLFEMTPQEALSGVTLNAAKALGMDQEIGSLEVGKRADLALWAVDHPAQLSYRMGMTGCVKRYLAGREVKSS